LQPHISRRPGPTSRGPYILPTSILCGAGRLNDIRTQLKGILPPSRYLCRSYSQRREARRSAGHAANQIRAGDQPQNGQSARPPNSRQAAGPRGRGHRMTAKMQRRAFITLLGGAATWPLVARAQQGGKLATVGVMASGTVADTSHLTAAFVQRLRELGWIEGRNVAIEYRWGEGRTERFTEIADEFVRLKVDLILTHNTPPTLA